MSVMITSSVSGQSEEDTSDAGGVGLFGYPYAFYTPETELAFGLGGMFYFRTAKDTGLELSNIVLSGYYTLNSQYSINLTPELYFGPTGDLFMGDFLFGKFLDKFYGFGSESPEISEPDYMTNNINVYLYYQKNITQNVEVGISYDYLNVTISDKENNPYLLSDAVRGSEGGVSSGIGFGLAWDSRDYAYLSTRGWYYWFKATYYSRALSGDWDFNEYVLDLREFYKIAKGHMVAFQGFGKVTRGYPPFYEVPRLGGGTTMRGYYEGRYRDMIYLTGQMEYKMVLFWRIGAVLFAGLGDVSPEFSSFKWTNVKYSYGFGLRYVFDFDERLTVRADFGFGQNTSGVYFSMQEAF